MGFLRLFIFGFAGLSIIYGLLWLYSRSVRREKLEDQWDANPPEGAEISERAKFIEDGMRAYHTSLRPKLLLLVYVVPTILIAVALYFTNYN